MNIKDLVRLIQETKNDKGDTSGMTKYHEEISRYMFDATHNVDFIALLGEEVSVENIAGLLQILAIGMGAQFLSGIDQAIVERDKDMEEYSKQLFTQWKMVMDSSEMMEAAIYIGLLIGFYEGTHQQEKSIG